MTASAVNAPVAIRTQRAFSLIELMVVMVIIGIFVGIVVMTLPQEGPVRKMQTRLTQMSAVLTIVSEEAQMQGRDFGIEVMRGGYRFVEQDPLLGVWTEVVGDRFLEGKTLPEEVEFDLFLEDRRIDLEYEAQDTGADDDPEDRNDRDLTDDYLPHILLMSSGDVSPFELHVVSLISPHRVGMRVTIDGQIEILDEDDLNTH